ncbi:membrane protein [Anaerocolumna cellulosilytica]|uniref:Membrane protein n=1 Tax=Anaerocolumna cellulosilytica TaxID=433286 RepID=A0A6S6QXV3_9FIRM|nr:DUF1538 domain-containing protein [Anaerocolumna cellulosilytica]MBB5194231.1 hypothetical protein [Anaerocolumna cellulosilytica]BCJ94556.1 membrane protein [Anaerocolumna cellulosilytica]
MNTNFLLKIKESISAVLPITILVLVLNFTIVPMSTGTLLMFLVGALMLILGMGLFTLGADISMMVMGEKIGSFLAHSRKIWVLIPITFLMGVLITIAEPDLQVLARQTPGVPDPVLIWAVALGVGIFLIAAFLRTLLQIRLSYILIVLYSIVFILAAFAPNNFIAVAFDSGGVTTGPITVPFIMALGIGMAAVRTDKASQEDSFGMVALCSVGPILAVLLLGIFYHPTGSEYSVIKTAESNSFAYIIKEFLHHFPDYMKEVAIALSPILIFFLVFQATVLKIPVKPLIKIMIGLLYTYLGLVLFLTGVNVGFMPAGYFIGGEIISGNYSWLLIPLGMVIGFVIVAAEPAVHVLNKQVEEISEGNITGKSMLLSLSIGVAISVGLAMLRVSTGLSIWYLVVPGYLLAVIMTFFVPPIFTSIAFDSGGVASGPMTATFLLPMAMGACNAVGGDMLLDAFGIVAMVAMTPLITIQALGLLYRFKTKRSQILETASEPGIGEFIFYDLDEYEEDFIDMSADNDTIEGEGTKVI